MWLMKRAAKAIAMAAATAAAGVVAERTLLAAPHYHGPETDHFDGERFHNLDPTLWQSRGSVLKWQFEDRERGVWPEWIESEPGPPPPERVSDGRMRITWVNHATLLIQADGVNILTDPIWSPRCSPVQFLGPKRHRAPGIRFHDLPPIDIVLLSHNHYDHLDVGTLHRLRATHAPRIVTPLGNALFLDRNGIHGAMELDWWRSVRVAGVEITCTPAQHFCARALSDRNRTLWGGFVVAAPSGNAYFAGDTGWGEHFASIAQRFAPIRAAMLPIGAYLPRWFMRPVHVEPAEAVEAHRVLAPHTSIAMHYGTFRLSDEGVDQPVADLRLALEASGVENFRAVDHGIGVEV
jgi:L-ascorbate metabolism protein UlaG (beta-lactamase superfamily)